MIQVNLGNEKQSSQGFKMIPLLEKKHLAMEELCRKYRVTRLEVFGSAAGDAFDPERSDIDFLVEFQIGSNLGPWMANYFDFQNELENLLGCKVDLVMESALKNPYFIKEVNRSKKLLYEAKVPQMA
jgi:predicted nucleotidyltransferase